MSPPDPAPEKRRTTRLFSPKVVVRIPSVDRFRTHYLKDISEGGLFVKAEKVLPVGSLLSLELWPPAWDHALEVSAKVTRSTDPATAAREGLPCGMAVQFVSVPEALDGQLKALVAEHRGAAAASDPVGAQVEALVRELSAARERLAALEADLRDVRGQNEAFTERLDDLQREEAEARAAAATLGEERTELERRLREAQTEAASGQAKLAEELAVARGEADATASQLDQEREEARQLRARAQQLATQLDEERQRARVDRERAERLSGELDKREARERDLRKLLDRVTGPSPLASIVEDEEVVVVAGSEPLDAGLAPPAARPPGAPSRPAEGNASPGEPEIDLDVGDLDLGDTSSFDADEEAAALFEDPPEPKGAEPDPAQVPAGFSAFSDGLEPRTRVMCTEELIGFEPVNEDERLLAELVGASPTFATLVAQVEGKLDDARLRRLLFDFDRRKLVELRT